MNGPVRGGHQQVVRRRSENGVVANHHQVMEVERGGALSPVSPTPQGKEMTKHELLQRLRANRSRQGGDTASGNRQRKVSQEASFRPQSPQNHPNSVHVEVEIHARLSHSEQRLDTRSSNDRRRSAQGEANRHVRPATSPESGQLMAPPPRRRYSNANVHLTDERIQNAMQNEQVVERPSRVSKEPVPLPRRKHRSQSEDRGNRQQKKAEAERQFLLQQYNLMQKQKQQQREKVTQQQNIREIQKEKLKQELKLQNEQEQRVLHKLKKFENQGTGDGRQTNWVKKQQQMFDRQEELKRLGNKKQQYLEATNRIMLEQQLMEKQQQEKQHQQKQLREKQQQQQEEQQRSSQQQKLQQKSSPPPTLPKPQVMEAGQGYRQKLQQYQQKQKEQMEAKQLMKLQMQQQQSERFKLQQQRLKQQQQAAKQQQAVSMSQKDEQQKLQQHPVPQPRTKTRSADNIKDLSPRGKDPSTRGRDSSSPRGSDGSNHSSIPSSEVRLINYRRRRSVGEITVDSTDSSHSKLSDNKVHNKSKQPQIMSPSARISQGLKNGASSHPTQKPFEKTSQISANRTEQKHVQKSAVAMQHDSGATVQAEHDGRQHWMRRENRQDAEVKSGPVSLQTTGNAGLDTKLKTGNDPSEVHGGRGRSSAVTQFADVMEHRRGEQRSLGVTEIDTHTSTLTSKNVGDERTDITATGATRNRDGVPAPHINNQTHTIHSAKSDSANKNDHSRKIEPIRPTRMRNRGASQGNTNSVINSNNILPEEKDLHEALATLHMLASNEQGSNGETTDLGNQSHINEASSDTVEITGVESVLNAKVISDSLTERGRKESTTLQDSAIRNLTAVSGEATLGVGAHKESVDTVGLGSEFEDSGLEVLVLDEEVERTCVVNEYDEEEQDINTPISRKDNGLNGIKRSSIHNSPESDVEARRTIADRQDELAESVSPIPLTETELGQNGEIIRRRRFVKTVSFHTEATELQQVIAEADSSSPPIDSTPPQEDAGPESPKRGILARGRFSGKRDHPSLSKQTGEMYRRPKSEYFDNARRTDTEHHKDDVPKRPQSALYVSPYDGNSLERGRSAPKHYRPHSDSLLQLDKFDSLQIKPPRRERSPSPGLRGFSSPVTQRKLRDRRRQQRMLPPPSNTLRMPRQPRPGRMAVIVDALKTGLVDSIQVSKDKLDIMKQHQEESKGTDKSRQGFHYNLDKQIKAAERYIRKLQFHLAKVEELQELYEKELKVREGAVNMVKAYHDTHTPNAKEPVSEAKVGVRDCTQALCHMEAELEANLGAFVLKIEGIAGFARVTRGDVFEITFKYGFQKWKTKCKVEKDLSQTWEGDEIVLYPMVGDFLTIKVTEIRGIARSNVTVGNLEFDTSDFYGAEPQNLTIDVNETGTIKLNVVVTWSPFHVDEDDLRQLSKNSYHRRDRTFTESVVSAHKRLSTASTSSSSDTPHSPVRPKPKPLEFSSSPTLTLEESLHNVVRLLEILNGQYNELKPLEQQIGHLESFLKKNLEKKRRESTLSLSIKNALDSFNFLNEVDEGAGDIDDLGNMEETNRKNTLDILDAVPKSHSSDRLSDSTCIEDDIPSQVELRSIHRNDRSPSTNSSTKRSSRLLDLSEKRESRMVELNEQRGSRLLDSPGDSTFGSMKRTVGSDKDGPLNLTTGSDSIDLTLTQHLMYIEYLLSHLGAFGPLKLKETIALDKLQKQAVIVEQLIVLAVSGVHITSADEVLPELKLNLPLLEFWEHCKEKEALYVNADSFLLQLDVKFGAKLRTNHPEIADDVFHSLCNRIIERTVDLLNPKTIITLFQYISFFTQQNRRNPEKFINDLTNEFELTASLEPGNPDLLRTIKRIPKGFLLPAGNLRALGLLLLEDSATVQTGVRMYLESIAREEDMRQRAVTVYLECLEERDLSLRQAGCAALAAMRATESLDQLMYLLRCDIDDVKTTAKEALMAFGEEGRLAYEQISYSPYVAYEQQYTPNGTPLMTTEL